MIKFLVFIFFLFCAKQLSAQHSDTVHLNKNTVTLTSYNDDKIIKEGDSLLDRNMIDEAIEKYSIVVELSPDNKTAIADRAFAYLQSDDYAKSLSDYNNYAINLDSTDYRSLSNRALVKWYLKDYKSGIIDCNKAIKYNANYAYAYFHKGNCQYSLNNYHEAIISYSKAIEIDSTFARAFYNRGNSNFNLNKKKDACNDWEKAKALGHEMADSMLQKYCN